MLRSSVSLRIDGNKAGVRRLKMSKEDESKVYYRQGTDVFLEGKSQPKFICSCQNIEMADFIVKRLMGD